MSFSLWQKIVIVFAVWLVVALVVGWAFGVFAKKGREGWRR